MLTNCGMPLDLRSVPSGATALHWAAAAGQTAMVRALLDASTIAARSGSRAIAAGVRAADLSKRTPLHYAASQGRRGVVELLLSHGAPSDNQRRGRCAAQAADGRTALQFAADAGELVVARVENCLPHSCNSCAKSFLG